MLRELAMGVHRFKDIRADTGAPRETFAVRLRTPEAAGIVERHR